MQLQVGLPRAKVCPCTHQEAVTSERSQAYPEYTIEEYWDQRIMKCVQNKFHARSGPREPVSLEWKIFVSCLNSYKHNAIKVRKNQKRSRTNKSSTHGLLRECQRPACHRFPGGNERQERKGAVPVQENGKDRGEGRECNQMHRKRE